MAHGDSGEYAALIKRWLVDIMYGNEGMYNAFQFLAWIPLVTTGILLSSKRKT